MFCRKCGFNNKDDADKCSSCGYVFEKNIVIDNYLVPAILVTIFCCQILGIVSIVYAAQVNSRINAGNIEGAKRFSQLAKRWMWISFGIGLLIQLTWMGINVFLLLIPAMQ